MAAQIALGALIRSEAVSPTGLDPTMLDLLVRLDQAPENRLRAVELSRQLMMSPSHISRTIDRAEALGLVARESDPDDRRATRLNMTATGRTAVEQFAPYLEAVINRVIYATLTPQEIDNLVELLGRIEDAACQPCPEEAP